MTPSERKQRATILALACGIIGGAGALYAAVTDPYNFFPAWLSAFIYWLSVPLGALALLMIHDLTGGRWEIIARGPLEAAASTMPLFVLAFLPLIAGFHDLYVWTRPHSPPPNDWYLNLRFFAFRAIIYFAVWNLFALRQAWRGLATQPAQWLSGIGLILFGVSVTWAAIDWIMSIEPRWFSSVYGMMVGSGQFLIALACVLAVIVTAKHPAAIDEAAYRRHLAKLATILLAVDIFWAYTSYSQWLIIWEENLHDEIPWYLERLGDFWRDLVLVIITLHFIIPLFTLVWSPAKRSPRIVGCVSAALLVGGILQVWWLVLPPFRASLSWVDAAAMLALGGVWLLVLLWRLDRGGIFSAPVAWHATGAKP